MTDRERRFSPVVLVGEALLLLCALMGLTGSFLSLYGDPDALRTAATALDRCAASRELFLLFAALFALCALAVWSLPRFRGAAAGGVAAVWALALWWKWKTVSTGAILACKAVADQFARRVDWGTTFEFKSGRSFNQDVISTQTFLLFALALLALALGWAVVRSRRWWVALLLTLPPLLPGLLADLYPDWLAFMALAACWCTMLLCDLCKWSAPTGRGRLMLTVFPAIAAVLTVITIIFPLEGYTRPAWALKAYEDLSDLTNRAADFFSQWDGPFRRTVTYVGTAEEADLGHAGPLSFTGGTVLRVTSDYDGRLYLRGSSLAVYEDGMWKPLPEGTYQEYLDQTDSAGPLPLVLPAFLALEGQEYTVTVNNVGAVGSCVYTPYFLPDQPWEELGMLPVEDSYFARRQEQWEHTMVFRQPAPGQELSIEEWAAQPMSAYRDYAYAHYLDVPEELRDRLNEICWMIGTPYYRGGAVYAAEVTAAYLDALCEYDPEAPAAPEGIDPVLCFLNDSQRGYCMHYASAAALLLRTMGIPARYVSGFTVESTPGRTAAVPDRAAHAWVEVWVDGFGWHPVEVTPAAAFTWYEQGTLDSEDLPTDAPPDETEQPTPTPEPSDSPDATEQPSTGPQDVDDDGPDNGESASGPTVPLWLVKALAAIAGVCALLWLGQYLPKKYRVKRLTAPDRDRAALDGYGYLKRMERWGGRMSGRAVELAQKAKFSQHTLTQEEAEEMRELVDRERLRLCVVLHPVKALLFRCWWGMPPGPKKPIYSENPPENGG